MIFRITRGPFLTKSSFALLIVRNEPSAVESALLAGLLECPACQSPLRPWGHSRAREVRCRQHSETRRFRRSRCASCQKTHVLIPEDTLSRRRDAAEVIGEALVAHHAGRGRTAIAKSLGRHESTVASWLRRFKQSAVRTREFFAAWAEALGLGGSPVRPTGSDFGDALELIGIVAALAVRRFGPKPVFHLASALTEGGLLATPSHQFRKMAPYVMVDRPVLMT